MDNLLSYNQRNLLTFIKFQSIISNPILIKIIDKNQKHNDIFASCIFCILEKLFNKFIESM